jgi:quinohemoprotein ethanol dehydrogenase
MPQAILVVLVAALLIGAIAPANAQDQEVIQAGEEVYEEHCGSCHGEKLRSTGAIPDLRRLGAGDRARFDQAVLEGRGQMPPWQGVLSPQQFDQLWAYIRRHAR